jgi:hypothetical protein
MNLAYEIETPEPLFCQVCGSNDTCKYWDKDVTGTCVCGLFGRALMSVYTSTNSWYGTLRCVDCVKGGIE